MAALRAMNWTPALTDEAAPVGAEAGEPALVLVLGLPVVAVVPVPVVGAEAALSVAESTAEVGAKETVEVPSSTLM